MHEYDIKSLETGQVLQTVIADVFSVDEHGIIRFSINKHEASVGSGLRRSTHLIGVTQASSSTLIVKRDTPKPALVTPIKEG